MRGLLRRQVDAKADPVLPPGFSVAVAEAIGHSPARQPPRHETDGIAVGDLWPGFSLLTADLLIFCRMVTPVCTVHTI